MVTAYMIFGVITGCGWFFLQARTTAEIQLTPAAEVFFLGFGLLIVLVVMGAVVVAVAVEDVLLRRQDGLYERIQEGRERRLERLEAFVSELNESNLIKRRATDPPDSQEHLRRGQPYDIS